MINDQNAKKIGLIDCPNSPPLPYSTRHVPQNKTRYSRLIGQWLFTEVIIWNKVDMAFPTDIVRFQLRVIYGTPYDNAYFSIGFAG